MIEQKKYEKTHLDCSNEILSFLNEDEVWWTRIFSYFEQRRAKNDAEGFHFRRNRHADYSQSKNLVDLLKPSSERYHEIGIKAKGYLYISKKFK